MSHQECTLDSIPDGHPVAVFARFWLDAAGSRAAPDWCAFDPVDHAPILPWVLLLQPEGPDALRYTVCGDGCVETFGFSYQGKIFGEDLPPEAVEIRRREFQRAQDGDAPLYSRTNLPIANREFVEIYRGVFPFVGTDGELQRIMVIIAPIAACIGINRTAA